MFFVFCFPLIASNNCLETERSTSHEQPNLPSIWVRAVCTDDRTLLLVDIQGLNTTKEAKKSLWTIVWYAIKHLLGFH